MRSRKPAAPRAQAASEDGEAGRTPRDLRAAAPTRTPATSTRDATISEQDAVAVQRTFDRRLPLAT